jgi:hypothetical protein
VPQGQGRDCDTHGGMAWALQIPLGLTEAQIWFITGKGGYTSDGRQAPLCLLPSPMK